MTELRAVGTEAARHRPHPTHAPTRLWPETNCYIDLWIELLGAWGRDPLPLLGLAVGLDWQADHFTFLKPAPHELAAAAGIAVEELALWDDTERQVATQVARGAVPLVEVDAFFLPDTASTAYRTTHTKTTIAIVAVDPEQRSLEYFHNAGCFRLGGDDYDGVLSRGPHQPSLFPYAELARPIGPAPGPADRRHAARAFLRQRHRSRDVGNPIERFAADLPGLMERVDRDPARIGALCFNRTRQLGGTAELLADHLGFLGAEGREAVRLAESAKTLQLLIARAARRGRADPAIGVVLTDMAVAWRRSMDVAESCAAPSTNRKAA